MTVLSKGARGDAVRDLQRMLNQSGVTPPLVEDADFGGKTDTAVRWFQGKTGLVVDGKAGPMTFRALEEAITPVIHGRVEPDKAAMVTSAAGRKAITAHEGNVLTAYPDPATGGEPWTIGVGHTSAAGLPRVVKGMRITIAESDEILSRDLKTFESGVRAAVKVPLKQYEFDALVSLAFNIGVGAFSKSTLVKMLNAGDRGGAADQFLVWNKAAGKVMKGLSNRRAAEREMFMGKGHS